MGYTLKVGFCVSINLYKQMHLFSIQFSFWTLWPWNKVGRRTLLKIYKTFIWYKKNTLLAVFMISIKSWFRLEKILCLRFTHYFQIPDPRLIQQLHFFSSLCCVSFVYQLVQAYKKIIIDFFAINIYIFFQRF